MDPLNATTTRRHLRTVMMVDLVESVRLMETAEAQTVQHWQAFMRQATGEVLPLHGGRLVRGVGDGLLLEFDDAATATRTALALHAVLAVSQQGRAAAEQLQLRAGINVTDIYADEHDIYGHGVNLAARLASLAGPGQTVVSAAVRDHLLAGVDADIEDLGDCYLKNLSAPVRAYRVNTAGQAPQPALPGAAAEPLLPTLAVLPFQVRQSDLAEGAELGDVLCDDLIAACSISGQWRVLSRLSCKALAARALSPQALRECSGASFTLSGSLVQSGARLRVMAELAETMQGHVLWARSLACTVEDLFAGQAQLLQDIVQQVSQAVVSHTLARAQTMALPTLEGYAILLRGVSGMHRSASPRNADAYESLEYLSDRHPRAAEPRAWLGKWHVIRLAQGWAEDPLQEAARARAHVQRALDGHPQHALALTIQGLVHLFTTRDLDAAQACLGAALQANPNEALAWLYQSSVHAHRGEGAAALACVARARSLSPLDPLRYYFDGFASWALLAAAEHERAEQFALASLRDNREHVPNYLILTLAQALGGRMDAACATAKGLMQRMPHFSVSRYVKGYPGGPNAQAHRFGDALRAAGLPD